MNFTKADIITTDKYLTAFKNLYYKTDVIYNNNHIEWRGNIHNPPSKNLPVIISGHSDYPIIDRHVDYFNPLIWYTVNKQTTRENVFALPLGITNHTNESYLHQIYGDLDCMIQVMNENIEKRTHLNHKNLVHKNLVHKNLNHKNLVYMNFNISTYPQERQHVYNLFSNKDWVTTGTTINTLAGRTDYLREIKAHNFVLCPRGNGVDTHRLWETLYMGSIPITKRDIAYKGFEDLPICFINDWSDINEYFLEEEKTRIMNNTYNLDKLKIGYWLERIRMDINKHTSIIY